MTRLVLVASLCAALAACGKGGDDKAAHAKREADNRAELCSQIRVMITNGFTTEKSVIDAAISKKDPAAPVTTPASGTSLADRVKRDGDDMLQATFARSNADQALRKELLPLYDAAAAAWKGTGDATAATKAVHDKEVELQTAPLKSEYDAYAKIKADLEGALVEIKAARVKKPKDKDLAALEDVANQLDGTLAASLKDTSIPAPHLTSKQTIEEYQKQKCP